MHEEFKYIQCGMKVMGIKMYYDSMLKEENAAQGFPTIKNRYGFQKLMGLMPVDQAVGERELHTVEDMKCNENHHDPIKYWSREIIKGMRWLMWLAAYTKYIFWSYSVALTMICHLTTCKPKCPL
jgi:hypothetical protein